MISIIVTVYKTERYIERFIKSIIAQTYKQFELIIINDGTPDNSIKIAKNLLLNSDINYKIVSIKNTGQAAARNEGLKYAQGEYVIFLDSDDYVSENFIECYMVLIKKYPKNDIIFANYATVIENKIKNNQLGLTNLLCVSNQKAEKLFLNRNLKFLITTMLIKKQFLQKTKIIFDPNVRYSEDIQFIWKVFAYNTKDIIVSEDILYYYDIHPYSIMTSSTVDKILTGCRGMQCLAKSEEIMHKLSPYVKKRLIPYWYISMLHGVAKQMNRNDFVYLFEQSKAKKQTIKLSVCADIKRRSLGIISVLSIDILYSILKKY